MAERLKKNAIKMGQQTPITVPQEYAPVLRALKKIGDTLETVSDYVIVAQKEIIKLAVQRQQELDATEKVAKTYEKSMERKKKDSGQSSSS